MEVSYLSIQKKTHHFASLNCLGVFVAFFLEVVTCTFELRFQNRDKDDEFELRLKRLNCSVTGQYSPQHMSLSTNFCIDPDVSTLFVKKTSPLRVSLIANSVSSAFKSKNPPVSPT